MIIPVKRLRSPSCSSNGRGRGFTGLLAVQRLVLALLLSATLSYGYTVLTHEAIVDSVWDTSMRKLLLKRFPGATPEELEQAHAYAYGGCIIQDMGYYPFSSRFFSDLTHYVRSGDFITALIRDSQDLNEYAFALGALEHYAADTEGHRIATNLAVPMLYPKLRRKFGSDVTYWDNPVAHIRTEFGFDVLQVASGRYATDQYRSFIGFQVARPLLERAFLDTYGIEMKDVFGNLTLALGSYRYSIGSIVPGMTRVAWSLKRTELQKEIPGITRKKFLYNLSRSSYEKNWGTEYRRPGFGTRLLTFLLEIIPKVGPFKALKIQGAYSGSGKNVHGQLQRDHRALPGLARRAWTRASRSSRTRISTWENRRRPANIREPTKPTPSWWESWRTSSLPPSPRSFARISWPTITTRNHPFLPRPTEKEKAESAKLLEELDRLKAVPEAVPVAQLH